MTKLEEIKKIIAIADDIRKKSDRIRELVIRDKDMMTELKNMMSFLYEDIDQLEKHIINLGQYVT